PDAGRSDAVGTGARLRAEGFDRRADRPLRDLAAVVAGLIAAGVVETGQARAAVAVAVLPVAVALSIAIAIASAPPPSAAPARTAAPAAVARTLAVAGAAAMLLAAAVLLRLRAAGAVSAGADGERWQLHGRARAPIDVGADVRVAHRDPARFGRVRFGRQHGVAAGSNRLGRSFGNRRGPVVGRIDHHLAR